MTLPVIGDPSKLNFTRSLVLCTAGALIGLAIAGYGLFTAAGTSTHSVPPEDMALINQRPILRSDFITQLEMDTGKRMQDTTRAEQLKVLDDMVREELLVQRALELDFGETDQGARNALASAISDQTIAEVTTSTPSDEQLREYFHKDSANYATIGSMSLRDFVVGPTLSTDVAKRIALELRQGTPAEKLISDGTLKESSHQVDEYYFTLDFRLGHTLFSSIENLPTGAVSEPVQGKDGWHIIQVDNNSKPVPLRFEVARSQVASDYMESERARRMAMTLRFLRQRSKILIAHDYADYRP